MVVEDTWQGGYKHFSEEEMKCKCGCGGLPKHSFMVKLDELREGLGFPLIVSSGFRCPFYNLAVSATGLTGPHTTGLAADIVIFGNRALKLIVAAVVMGMTGIGVKQKGSHSSRFIHLDCLADSLEHPRPWPWSY